MNFHLPGVWCLPIFRCLRFKRPRPGWRLFHETPGASPTLNVPRHPLSEFWTRTFCDLLNKSVSIARRLFNYINLQTLRVYTLTLSIFWKVAANRMSGAAKPSTAREFWISFQLIEIRGRLGFFKVLPLNGRWDWKRRQISRWLFRVQLKRTCKGLIYLLGEFFPVEDLHLRHVTWCFIRTNKFSFHATRGVRWAWHSCETVLSTVRNKPINSAMA